MKYNYLKEEEIEKSLNVLRNILKRDVVKKKSVNDYNFNLFSNIRDRVVGIFMDAGQNSLENGEIVELTGLSRYFLFDKMDIYDSDLARELGDYKYYFYNLVIENELRAKFLLQTEAKDDFPELYKELKNELSKFLNKDEIDKIDKAVNLAKDRLYATKIAFLGPYEGLEEGELVKLSDKEKEENNINMEVDAFVDNRFDSFDLLSLKELVLVLKGKDVEEYSIAMGFFSKIMPELNKCGIDSIIMKTEDKKVKDLSLVSFYSNKSLYYSPLRSALALAQNSLFEVKEEIFTIKERELKKTSFVNFKEIGENEQFFVAVDGNISLPSNDKLVGYEENAINSKEKKVGEVFLYKKNKSVRLFFSPYDYDGIPLIHQHGSVIFGSNDQTYHSVSERRLDDISITMRMKYQEMLNVHSERFKLPEGYCPAVIATMYKNKNEDPISILKNMEDLGGIIKSQLEESSITNEIELNEFSHLNMVYNKEELKKEVLKLITVQHPLSKSFNLKRYVDKNELSELQKTKFYNIALLKYDMETIDALSLADDE